MNNDLSFRQFLREMKSLLRGLGRETEIKGFMELWIFGFVIYILSHLSGRFGLIILFGLGSLWFIRFLYWTWRVIKESEVDEENNY